MSSMNNRGRSGGRGGRGGGGWPEVEGDEVVDGVGVDGVVRCCQESCWKRWAWRVSSLRCDGGIDGTDGIGEVGGRGGGGWWAGWAGQGPRRPGTY